MQYIYYLLLSYILLYFAYHLIIEVMAKYKIEILLIMPHKFH